MATPKNTDEIVRGRGCPRVTIRMTDDERDELAVAEKEAGIPASEILRAGINLLRETAKSRRRSIGQVVVALRRGAA